MSGGLLQRVSQCVLQGVLQCVLQGVLRCGAVPVPGSSRPWWSANSLILIYEEIRYWWLVYKKTCVYPAKKLQRTATHCNTLQHWVLLAYKKRWHFIEPTNRYQLCEIGRHI